MIISLPIAAQEIKKSNNYQPVKHLYKTNKTLFALVARITTSVKNAVGTVQDLKAKSVTILSGYNTENSQLDRRWHLIIY